MFGSVPHTAVGVPAALQAIQPAGPPATGGLRYTHNDGIQLYFLHARWVSEETQNCQWLTATFSLSQSLPISLSLSLSLSFFFSS